MSDATRLKDVHAVDDWYDDAADGGTHVWSSGAGLNVTAGGCGGICVGLCGALPSIKEVIEVINVHCEDGGRGFVG